MRTTTRATARGCISQSGSSESWGIPSALFHALTAAPLRWWNPEENGALFTNMLEMLADYDIHPRAVLWYQGEAEGYEDSAQTYLERFAAFVRHTRAALGQPELPFLTCLLYTSRCV